MEPADTDAAASVQGEMALLPIDPIHEQQHQAEPSESALRPKMETTDVQTKAAMWRPPRLVIPSLKLEPAVVQHMFSPAAAANQIHAHHVEHDRHLQCCGSGSNSCGQQQMSKAGSVSSLANLWSPTSVCQPAGIQAGNTEAATTTATVATAGESSLRASTAGPAVKLNQQQQQQLRPPAALVGDSASPEGLAHLAELIMQNEEVQRLPACDLPAGCWGACVHASRIRHVSARA